MQIIDIAGAQSQYLRARRRLFLLDYDGTLAPLARTPEQAKPTPELLQLLRRLCTDSRNTVVVISGRDRQTLDAWLGELPVFLVAEHGFAHKDPQESWIAQGSVNDSWKKPARAWIQKLAKTVNGTFVEEKDSALCWHYRTADSPKQATATLQEQSTSLSQLCAQLQLRAMYGNKVVELQPIGTDKGSAAKNWLDQKTWDFILAAGDDVTDEDLFAACPPEAITIKIGAGKTKAKARFESPHLLITLLSTLPQSQTLYRHFRRFVADYTALIAGWMPTIIALIYMVTNVTYLGMGILLFIVFVLPITIAWGVFGTIQTIRIFNPKTRNLNVSIAITATSLFWLVSSLFYISRFIAILATAGAIYILYTISQQDRLE